jgi:hypothetical protein
MKNPFGPGLAWVLTDSFGIAIIDNDQICEEYSNMVQDVSVFSNRFFFIFVDNNVDFFRRLIMSLVLKIIVLAGYTMERKSFLLLVMLKLWILII